MLWIIGPIIVVLLVLAAGFRKTAAALLAAVLVAGVLVYQHNERTDRRAASNSSISQIALENVALRRTFDSSYELTGTVRNKSEEHRVDGLSVHVILRDCTTPDGQNCAINGEVTVEISVTVRPLESRSFTGALYLGKAHRPTKGVLLWDYRVVSVISRQDPNT